MRMIRDEEDEAGAEAVAIVWLVLVAALPPLLQGAGMLVLTEDVALVLILALVLLLVF